MNSNEKGFSLIEVMVSLVILVVGLVGVFNLHIISKQGSFESFQQTQASFLAHDIINRMKLNPSELARYAGTFSEALAAPENACDTIVSPCTPQQIVTADLADWSSTLSGKKEMYGNSEMGSVEKAKGCIVVNGNSVSVAISWRSIREIRTNNETNGHYSGDWSCGNSDIDAKRKRLLVVNTVINGI